MKPSIEDLEKLSREDLIRLIINKEQYILLLLAMITLLRQKLHIS